MTRHAVRHTLHCLVGCGIGEILGSGIGAALQWSNAAQTGLAILLAFFFGYLLTFLGGRRMGMSVRDARNTALRTDTISITCMELVDNSLLWLIPNAMQAAVFSMLFWGSMALSLGIAFILTVPVNRYVMTRYGIGHSHGHADTDTLHH